MRTVSGDPREGLVPVADLTAVIESSSDAILRQDATGAVVVWNRAAQRLLGRPAEAMRGTTLSAALAGPAAAIWAEALEHVRAGARREGLRLDIRQRGGLVVPASVTVSPAHAPDGRTDGAWVVARDLSEQVLAQRTLAESEQRVHQSELLAGTGSFVVDRDAGAMQWSAGMYAIARLDPLDVEPSVDAYLDLVHPDDRAGVAAAFATALAGDAPPDRDHRLVRADGSPGWVFLALAPSRGPAGVRGVTGVCQDVTERKAVEAAKEDFLSTVSHELRTPLTAVLGFASLLHADAPDLDEFVDPIVRNARHMHEMVERLLDYSRLEAGRVTVEPREIEFGPVLDASLERMGAALEGRKLDVAVEPGLLVRADPDALERILVNLVGNALKYGPPEAAVAVQARRGGGAATVSVADRGPGIAAEHHTAVFERYFRVPGRAVATGTGVGLAIVRQYVELHGGHAWVESIPGDGATFFFTLPDGPADGEHP
jgi:two-component system, NtrC family, sensor histidine kinase KinB